MSSPYAGKLPPLTLVLGGARSGKSRFAEALVEAAAVAGTYCATAEAKDDEMTARIAAHRARRGCGGRGAFWRTVEAPLALAGTVGAEANPERALLIDCLTLWLSNLLLAGRPIDEEFAMLRAALRDAAGPIVLVANEVGLGLVPETPLGRRFRDAAGALNQEIAALADRVVFVAAGLPLVLKETSATMDSPSPPFRGPLGARGRAPVGRRIEDAPGEGPGAQRWEGEVGIRRTAGVSPAMRPGRPRSEGERSGTRPLTPTLSPDPHPSLPRKRGRVRVGALSPDGGEGEDIGG